MRALLRVVAYPAAAGLVLFCTALFGAERFRPYQEPTAIAPINSSASFSIQPAQPAPGSSTDFVVEAPEGITQFTPTPTITPCPQGAVLYQDFDGVTAPALPAGWTASNALGPDPLWVTSTTHPLNSPNCVFVDDPPTVSDKRLDSIAIPIGGQLAQVAFEHAYDFENGFDGGVLEISSPNINEGEFTDIADPAVGGSFLVGGYNAIISIGTGNPIAGRLAWSGNSNDYTHAIADLGPNVFGQFVKFRFRMGSDNSGSGSGWRVDVFRVLVYCQTPTPSPTATSSITPTPTCVPDLTQSTSSAITPLNSVSCNNGTGHTDNSYWRAFNMASVTGGHQYVVKAVAFGVESANNTQPVTVRLYANNGGAFPAGTLTEIGAATVNIMPNQSGNVVTVPLGATVPPNTGELVMELFTPDGTTAGNLFFVGSNKAPQSGPSYVSAAACEITTPTDLAALGFPNMHIVFHVLGACPDHTPSPTPRPTATSTATATSSATPTATFTPTATATASPSCLPLITQSTSQLITTFPLNCGRPPPEVFPYKNHYWRAFNLEQFTGGTQYNVSYVSFGIAQSYDVTVQARLYANNGAPFPQAIGTLIGSTTVDLTMGQGGSIISAPLVTTVPAGTRELVMELFIPYPASVVITVGANTDPQTGPSYWSCEEDPPAVISQHIVFNIHGTCPGTPTPTPTNTATATATASPTVQPTPTATPPHPAHSLNLSSRMLVLTGDQVAIGGFIITGSDQKQLLLRAIGPSLGQVGVPNALADPTMELHGPNGFTIVSNDNWKDTQRAKIKATGLAPTNDLESAILVTLDPGAYTAIVRGKNETSGVGLVEIYDLGPMTSQLANIRTRAYTGTGNDVLIGGFILGDGTSTNIVIRADASVNPGFDPTLELRNVNGTLIAANDNCGAARPHESGEGLIGIFPCPPEFCSPGSLTACLNAYLPPGAYTAITVGKNGSTGIGLLEIYNLQTAPLPTPTPSG